MTLTTNGSTTSSCSYSSMSVQPDGSFNVICSASTPTPAPAPAPGTDAGVFNFTSSTGTGPVIGGDNPFPVVRTVGTTGAVSMTYTVAGAGCQNGVGTLNFADGQNSLDARVWGLVSGQTCTITLGTPTTTATVNNAPRLGTPSVITVTIGSSSNSGGGTPPPPVSTASCPTGFTEPADLLVGDFKPVGNVLLQMQKSGQTVALTLPQVASGYHSGQFVFSESAGGAYTPQPVTLSISVSKCRGYIDTNPANTCNLVSTNGNYNSMTWFASAYSVIADSTSASQYGYCWAPASEGPWYVNAQWTYSQCAFGAGVCGFAVQQNLSGW